MPYYPITDKSPLAQFTATSGQTAFPFNFYVNAEADLAVYKNGVLLTLNTDYTVSGLQDNDGGTVTLTAGADEDDEISIFRKTVMKRETGYTTSGSVPAASLNQEFGNFLTMLQDLKRDILRTFRLADFAVYDGSLAVPTPEPGKAIVWNSAGDGLDNSVNVVDTIATLAAASATAAAASEANAAASATAAAASEASAEALRDAAELAETNAEMAQFEAEIARDEAVAAVSSVNPPDPAGNGGNYFRQKGDESGYEYRTNAETFEDIKQLATEALAGVVEKATEAEMAAGTADKFPDAELIKAFVEANGGVVKQIVGTTVLGGSSTTSTAATDVTGASLSITPTSATSKVLVLASWGFSSPLITGVNVIGYHRLLRDATAISGNDAFLAATEDSDGGNRTYGSHAFMYLDSPATAAAVTYKLQHRVSNSSGTLTTQRVIFVLIEVEA